MNGLIFNLSGTVLLLLPFVVFLVVCALTGGLIVYLFKINRFWPAAGQMLGISLVNTLIIFLLWFLLSRMGYAVSVARFRAPVLLLSWLVSVFVEGGLLKLLNASQPLKAIFLASMVMNLIAFVVIYLVMLSSAF